MTATIQEKQEVMRFVVLRGKHHDGDETKGTYRCYRVGDEVESTKDLVKMFGREKFMRLHSGMVNPVKAEREERDEDLASKTVEQLKAIAAEWEIDLGGAKTKAEILATIKAEMD